MNLHEYQIKQLLTYYGLLVPVGYPCTTPIEAKKATSKIGPGPWVVKCQIHAGGRYKVGGIKIFNNKEDIYIFAKRWLGKRLITYQTSNIGQLVNQILVEKAVNIKREIYLGATIDPSLCRLVFIASIHGGTEIEKITKVNPHLIHRVIIDPFIGPMPYQGRELAFKLNLKSKLVNQFTSIFMKLVSMFLKHDLELIEINPLAIDHKDNLICIDSKLKIDKSALFRQPNLYKMRDQSQEDPRETQASQWKLNYVTLDGNIGCVVNGAGLAMSIIDIVKSYGGELANFLDVGGCATKENIIEAFKIVLSNKNIKAILVNIFGGIIRCDLIAEGIISAVKEVNNNIPFVIHLDGNQADIGERQLIKSGINIFITKNIEDAIQKVVNLARKISVYSSK